MNTRELKRTIAARLLNCIQKEAQEVLTVLVEVVRKKLMEIDHFIYIQGLGRLPFGYDSPFRW